MDSLDTSHVPPPDPEYFWRFKPRQPQDISPETLSAELLDNPVEGQASAEFEITVHGEKIRDRLNLDKPCVALRFRTGEPMITFTLRKICRGEAYIQITVSKHLGQAPKREWKNAKPN